MPNCRVCQQPYAITAKDTAFYQKLAVPPPTLCPTCRLRRRLVFRNERRLYQRQCDLCHQAMIAIYPADAPFPVYCVTCWWSDQWDPLSYGRTIDWQRPFFEQFRDLFQVVPKAASLQLHNENSPYNSFLAFSKNTYMSPGSYLMENCYYTRKSQHCRDCVNSAMLNKCELVASSIHCDHCYQSHHLVNSKTCSFSSYLLDCTGVQHSFMCCGIKNQNYCFKNKTYSPAEYERIKRDYAEKSEADVLEEFKKFCLQIPRRSQIQTNCENSTGDYLFNSHQATDCFDSFDIDNSKYLLECSDVTDSMDLNMQDKEVELCYELSSGGEKNYLTKFGFCPVAAPETEYTISCFYLNNSFGCDQIHTRNQYCILNKPYSQEDYMQLRDRLITHMRNTGEYGEFFPAELSPFAYNDTVAQDCLPLTSQEASQLGWRWNAVAKTKTADPSATTCVQCQQPFRVIDQEKNLYRTIGVAVPDCCLDCRYQSLLTWKNPRVLFQRSCARCTTQIQTTYAPERPEVVYCDDCYRAIM